MPDLEYETLGRPPRAGDVIVYTEERIIPLGTWGVALDPFLTAYTVRLRERLAEDGYLVEVLEDRSSIEATSAFRLEWTVYLRVLEAPPEPPEAELEHLEAAWWAYFAGVLIVLGALVGWVAHSFARIEEARADAPVEPQLEREATKQTFAVALVLLVFALLLWRTLP